MKPTELKRSSIIFKPLEKWVEDAVNEATDSEECEEEDEE